TEVRRPDRRTVLLTTGRAAMGTLVSVSALGPGRDRLEDAVGRAFQEMDRLIAVFSRFAADSALTVLNDAGRLSGPPRELAFVLERALGYHETTGGAFDVTVAPLVDLFRNRLRDVRPAPPAEAEIRAARALVGVGRVRISRREIRFQRSGMAITLDGIAKGYIVDAMATVLARAGVRDFLINAGGDIRTAGRGAGGRPWTVGVRDPDGSGALPDVLHVTDAAVATSGGYEIWFDPERRFHHIVDAGTGRSPRHNAAASVLAPTAMAADALATAVFVLPPARGLALVDSLAGCACLIIGADGRQWRSAGWRSAPPLPTPTAME
ncbi:MAG TPA: FAD:protein FMN transferase, partial [Gemmatimonadales bacterium]|nr:FAD:protein FMN transferase [Gemmatimonadales bacterium]